MTTVMKSAIEEIEAGMNQASERAQQRAANGGKRFVSNTIMLLKHGQTATLRPIYNMDQAIVFYMHDKFKNTDASLSADKQGYPAPIAALCAEKTSEQPCVYCVNARENKLEANREAFVPVYVQKVVDQHQQAVTYKGQDGEMKPVQGFRMLRLKMGSPILAILMSVYKDSDYSNDITGCNFTVSRIDAPGQGKQPPRVTYSCTPKPPTPMNPNLKAHIPPLQGFCDALLEVFPEHVVQGANYAADPLNGALGAIEQSYKVVTGDPAIDTFVQAVNNAYKVAGEVSVPSSPEIAEEPESYDF